MGRRRVEEGVAAHSVPLVGNVPVADDAAEDEVQQLVRKRSEV